LGSSELERSLGEFGTCLLEAFNEAGVQFDSSWQDTAAKRVQWLKQSGADKIAGAAVEMAGAGSAYNASFSLLNRWLAYDGKQIEAIRDKIGDRRVVVLIDDLDRADPELISQLLLSLRELLDLPRFTFVLAFDDEIVGAMLTGKNPAWPNGSDFLDKILDFRFNLPSVSDDQKNNLLLKAIALHCGFVPEESVNDVQRLVPGNPRKLKGLVRSMAALKPQITRHESNELSWREIWIAQMLRQESFEFLIQLLDGDTYGSVAGTKYHMEEALKRHGDVPIKQDADKSSVEALLESACVGDAGSRTRIIELIEALRSRNSINDAFRYCAELTLRPHAVTWGEYNALRKTWVADEQSTVIGDWIVAHASTRGIANEAVEEDLFTSVLHKRDLVLRSAADSRSLSEHESLCDEADQLMRM
jgi:hypothetical protein